MKPLLAFLILLIGLTACDTTETVSIQGFESSEFYLSESSGFNNITINLGSGLSTSTTVTITISGTAGMDGDFFISNPQNIIDLGNGLYKVTSLETGVTSTSQVQYTVLPGQKTLTIPVRIIDDIQLEPTTETIRLEISEISDSKANLVNNITTIYIEDNDTPQAGLVQVDLSWETESGGSINTSNFDLFLVKNFKGNNSATATYDLLGGFSAANETGFETLWLDQSLTNETYYIMVKYLSGGSTARIKLVVSQTNDIKTVSAVMRKNQIGTSLFFGPINKTTTGYSYRQ